MRIALNLRNRPESNASRAPVGSSAPVDTRPTVPAAPTLARTVGEPAAGGATARPARREGQSWRGDDQNPARGSSMSVLLEHARMATDGRTNGLEIGVMKISGAR